MESNIPKCNTLVFFDVETSGLPAFQVARITELSFWAVERSQFLATKNKVVPRVTNRLNLCVYPSRLIDPAASQITGLDNYNLEHQSPFNEETANTVLGFLNRLKRPVCLIAHNGNNFDFPLLKSEVEKLGKELPSHILCCDSLPLFKKFDLDMAGNATISLTEISIEAQEISNSEAELILNSTTVDNIQFNHKSSQQHAINPFQYENERTPVKRRSDSETDGRHDKRSKSSLPSPAKKSYRLGAIYERVFNEPADSAHHAEADVKMLMLAAASYSSSFLDELDANAKPFASVKKLW